MTKIPDINLNQNLWALIISLAALGVSEFYSLEQLNCIAYWLTIIVSVSYLVTLVAYTFHYCKKKFKG